MRRCRSASSFFPRSGRSSRGLEAVWVSGEVANFTRAASGHWYFVLRDARAQVSCAMMAGENRRTGLDRLNNGDKLVVLGKPTMYAPRGHFQLAVRSLRLDGVRQAV